MRIAIEARALSLSSRGVHRYALELIRSLLVMQPPHQFTVLRASQNRGKKLGNAREYVIPLGHEFLLWYWLMWQLPQALKKLSTDLVHFTKADVPTRKTIPTVVT